MGRIRAARIPLSARFLVSVLSALILVGGYGDAAHARSSTSFGVAPSHVNGTPIDPLFSSYPQWSSVADQIDFFKYYGCMYSWCGPVDTSSMVSFMAEHGIDLACEYGDFPSGDNAAYNFSIRSSVSVSCPSTGMGHFY